jgi:5-methylcytosine-specific restriction endonuclease McrA
MKNKKLNAVQVWKQTEDLLIPQLHLDLVERAVYYHLLRHSHFEGKLRFRFSIYWLARSARISGWVARRAVRSLVAKGVLRLYERSRAGHLVDVRLPGETRAIAAAARMSGKADLEEVNFLESRPLREAIHRRERGHCFYCSRRLSPKTRCLDHVVPQAQMGSNSYRNLVSCCGECNSLKADRGAERFLRWLFRQGRIDSTELTKALRALKALAAGNFRPALPSAVGAK